MLTLTLCFSLFASLALISAIMVIVSRQPIQSVLYLILCFLSTAPIWLIFNAEFLALILILVYVGAVMTLFLFVVMMTDLGNPISTLGKQRGLSFFLGVNAMGLLLYGLSQWLLKDFLKPLTHNVTRLVSELSDIEHIGMVLYTDHVLAFMTSGLILLLSIVASIALLHRPPRTPKTQIIADQLNVSAKDRIQWFDQLPNKQQQAAVRLDLPLSEKEPPP